MRYNTLNSICNFVSEKRKTQNLTLNNYISTENMLQNKGGITKSSGLPTTTQTQAFETGDILVSNIRPYFKKIWLADECGGCSNDVLVFRARENVSSEFLYYILSNDEFFDYATKTAKGTKMPRGDKKAIMLYEVPIINIQTQQSIANVLRKIDLKIELNNKINDNLEKQAQAILQDWESNNVHHFKISKIDDIAEINASNYSPKEDWQYVNYLDTSSITKGIVSEIQLIDLQQDKLPSRAKRKVNTGEIVYSTVRPNQLHFGLINNPLSNMLVSTGFAVINSKNSNINNEFLYLQLTKLDIIEKLQQIAEQSTSTFPAIKPSDIGNLSISLPSKEDADMMKILKNKFALIANNQQQNQKLAQLRDTLLPRLMSGEIDVSEVEI